MPTPTLVLDTVQGADLELTPVSGRYVRTGYVKDIELDATNDPEALVKVRPYLPPWYSILGPRSTNMQMVRIRVRPELSKVGMVRVELVYEINAQNYTPTLYLLRDRSFSGQKSSGFIPGSRESVMVSYNPDGAATPSIAAQPVFFDYNVTYRSIQVTSLQYGRPATGAQDYVNYVNDAAWPSGSVFFNGGTITGPFGTGIDLQTSSSRPIGYWRLSQYGTELNRQAGMTLTQAEAVTKNIEDWSDEGYMQDPKTGKYPFGGLDTGTRAGVISAMAGLPYNYGKMYPLPGATAEHGIVRIGPYPLASFFGIFGFIFAMLLSLSLVFNPNEKSLPVEQRTVTASLPSSRDCSVCRIHTDSTNSPSRPC